MQKVQVLVRKNSLVFRKNLGFDALLLRFPVQVCALGIHLHLKISVESLIYCRKLF